MITQCAKTGEPRVISTTQPRSQKNSQRGKTSLIRAWAKLLVSARSSMQRLTIAACGSGLMASTGTPKMQPTWMHVRNSWWMNLLSTSRHMTATHRPNSLKARIRSPWHGTAMLVRHIRALQRLVATQKIGSGYLVLLTPNSGWTTTAFQLVLQTQKPRTHGSTGT